MKNKVQCDIVSDLLPLYVDNLTSESTNTFIKNHLDECPSCQKEYCDLKAELCDSKNSTKIQEIEYLKKINIYQNVNLILGAIISFLFGACIPALRVGIPIFLSGSIPEYYLARLQIAWHIGLLKMFLSGIVVCGLYCLVMFWVRKKIKYRK